MYPLQMSNSTRTLAKTDFSSSKIRHMTKAEQLAG